MRRYLLLAATVLLTLSLSARADTFTFTVPLTGGAVTGSLQGTLDLGFITNQGSGTGAATSLTFTSIPSGFGTLTAGNTATSWANQVSNTFTVVNGLVTNYLFFAANAASDPTDAVCLNSSTTSRRSFGGFACPPQLNELHTSATLFGYNSRGLAGATFQDVSSATAVTPEPSSLALLSTGLLGVTGVARRRFAARYGRV